MRGRRWLPVLLWVVLILTLTSIPNPNVPDVTGGDKAAHLIMYGVLGALVGRALRGHPRPVASRVVALVIVAVIAAADELHQQFIPGRAAETADWVADVLGAAAGLLITYTASPSGRREPA